MGEYADDIIEGVVCDICGCFFEESQGFPATCRACWKSMNQRERKAHQMSDSETIN